MRIALIQSTTGIDPRANATELVAAIGRAAAASAVIVFTPEMSGLLDRDGTRAAAVIAAEEDDLVLAAVRGAAAAHRMWVQLGSLAIRRADGKLANRSFLIGPDGTIRSRYDKMHLFDVDLGPGGHWRESDRYAAGDRPVVADGPDGRIGLSICYDLRFPDLYRALTDAGATILSVPAAFTRPTGAAHWHTLLRARAIEAACFVVAAAQTGVHQDGRETYGHSLVVDPWGRVLLDMGGEPDVGVVDIDPDDVPDVRARIPSIRHRRPIPPVAG